MTGRPGGRPTPPEELFDDVVRVARLLGRAPTRAEYRELGEHAPATVRRRLGTPWMYVKLDAADEARRP